MPHTIMSIMQRILFFISLIALVFISCGQNSSYQIIREPEEYRDAARNQWDFLLLSPWLSMYYQSGMENEEINWLDKYQINQTVMEINAVPKALRMRVQTGNPPDVFMLWPDQMINRMMEMGQLEDLSFLAFENSLLKKDDPLWNLVSCRGQIYGIPQSVVLEGLFCDTSIVPVEEMPRDRDELYLLIQKLREEDILPFYVKNRHQLSYLYQLIILSLSDGADYQNTMTYQGVQLYRQALEEMRQLFLAGAFDRQAIENLSMARDSETPLVQGKYAFIPDGSWAVLEVSPSFDTSHWDFFPFPAFKDKGRPCFIHALGGDTLYITGNQRDEKEKEDLFTAVSGYLHWLHWIRETDSRSSLQKHYPLIYQETTAFLDSKRNLPDVLYAYPPDYFWDRIFWDQQVVNLIPAYMLGIIREEDIWPVQRELFYD